MTWVSPTCIAARTQAFYDGIRHEPDRTFGNVKADVLAGKDPTFKRGNFCSVIRGSAWPSAPSPARAVKSVATTSRR
jgi:hypothetical protein